MPAKRKPDPVTQYAKDVVKGKIIAGRPVRLACERHLRDVKRSDLVWRADKAKKAIEFFEEILVLEDGSPFTLQPFQQFIVGSIFGWYGLDGYRRFRTAYIETAKGSGKTPLAAGVGLYGMVADGEPAAEIYSAAVTRDQAKLVWRDADRMVKASEELSDLIRQNVNLLSIPEDSSIFRPVSSEHRGLDGLRVHIALVDELHEHPSSMVVDKIRAGTKRRPNALIFEITNSGYDRHSVCWNHHEHSLKVLEGIFQNDTWFAYIASLDEAEGEERPADDWRDEKVWVKANPGLDTILPRKYLREQVQEAITMPSKENLVKRLNFCIWTEQSVRWLPMPIWDKGSQPFSAAKLKGRKCYGGLDLARVNDLSALALLFPPVESGELWKALMWYWLPEMDIQPRVEKDMVPYDVWASQKLIKITPGNVTDFGYIEKDIVDLAGVYNIVDVAYDRTFAGELVQNLGNEGLVMMETGQGFLSMASPTAELERMVKGEELQHGGHPVLRWNASNVSVAQDAAGNIKPDKARSRERIDGVVALIMALDRAIRHGAKPKKSVYSQRGVRGL